MTFGIGLSNVEFEIVLKKLSKPQKKLMLEQFKKYQKILFNKSNKLSGRRKK